VLQREATLALAGIEDTIERARRIGAGKVGVLRLGVTGSASYGVLPRARGDQRDQRGRLALAWRHDDDSPPARQRAEGAGVRLRGEPVSDAASYARVCGALGER